MSSQVRDTEKNGVDFLFNPIYMVIIGILTGILGVVVLYYTPFNSSVVINSQVRFSDNTVILRSVIGVIILAISYSCLLTGGTIIRDGFVNPETEIVYSSKGFNINSYKNPFPFLIGGIIELVLLASFILVSFDGWILYNKPVELVLLSVLVILFILSNIFTLSSQD